jgi:hypothetical protein
VSYKTTPVLVGCRRATTAPVATRGCAGVCTIDPDKAIAALAAMPTTYDRRTDRRAFRRSSMRRRFTAVRPASPFHGGSTCVAVSRRFDLRRRFMPPGASGRQQSQRSLARKFQDASGCSRAVCTNERPARPDSRLPATNAVNPSARCLDGVISFGERAEHAIRDAAQMVAVLLELDRHDASLRCSGRSAHDAT